MIIGNIRPICPASEDSRPTMACDQSETEDEMSYYPTGMALCRLGILRCIRRRRDESYTLRALDYLNAKVEEEIAAEEFSELPFRYAEIAKVLLDTYVLWYCCPPCCSHPDASFHTCRASDNIQQADKVRFLLKELREARQAKARKGLARIDFSLVDVCSPNP
jgi:hypothetical protein